VCVRVCSCVWCMCVRVCECASVCADVSACVMYVCSV